MSKELELYIDWTRHWAHTHTTTHWLQTILGDLSLSWPSLAQWCIDQLTQTEHIIPAGRILQGSSWKAFYREDQSHLAIKGGLEDALTSNWNNAGMLQQYLLGMDYKAYYTQTKSRVEVAPVRALSAYGSPVMRVVLHWLSKIYGNSSTSGVISTLLLMCVCPFQGPFCMENIPDPHMTNILEPQLARSIYLLPATPAQGILGWGTSFNKQQGSTLGANTATQS